MFPHPHTYYAVRLAHTRGLLAEAERRRLIEQATAQVEQASWLARFRCAAWRFAAMAGAILPSGPSVNRPDAQAGVLPEAG